MKKTILVVDDEPTVVELIKAVLTDQNYQIITAANGEDGLRQAVEAAPRLIILDIMMPKVDGFEVLARLKRDSRTSKIPVVMLSGKGDTGALFLSQDLRADDYLIKPFTPNDLVKVVQQYVC